MRHVYTFFIIICIFPLFSCTSLLIGAIDGNIKEVKRALNQGQPIDKRTVGGSTALILAAENNNSRIVEYLCFHGANVNARTNSGATALHSAAYYNYLDVAKVLIKYKADKTIRDGYGNTALDYAKEYGYHRIIELLSYEEPKYAIKTPFGTQGWQSNKVNGDCELIGHAFLRVKVGESKTCAGQNVYLMPYNDYTKEIFAVKRSGKHGGFSNTDPRIQQYIRKTFCNNAGIFRFKNIPCGEWIISTRVEWHVFVDEEKSVIEKHGGQLMKPVEVKDGTRKKVFMTDDDKVF